MHMLPILSAVRSSRMHPASEPVPTMPRIVPSGSRVDFAKAAPGRTVNLNGEPGNANACWRRRTCSKYSPARPIEYETRWTSWSWPCACKVPGSTPPKPKPIPNGSALSSKLASNFNIVLGITTPSADLLPAPERSLALRSAHCCICRRRAPGSSLTRDVTSLRPSLARVTHPTLHFFSTVVASATAAGAGAAAGVGAGAGAGALLYSPPPAPAMLAAASLAKPLSRSSSEGVAAG